MFLFRPFAFVLHRDMMCACSSKFFCLFLLPTFFLFFFWKPPLFGFGVFSVVVLVQLSFNHVGHSFVGSKRFFLFSVHHGEKGFQPQQQSKFFFSRFPASVFSETNTNTYSPALRCDVWKSVLTSIRSSPSRCFAKCLGQPKP